MSDTKKQYFGSVGKRKTAIARIKLYQSGTGEFVVNGMPLKAYFTGVQIENAVAPLALIGAKTGYDLDAYVVGGGKMSQSDAVRHGVTRALLLANPDIRSDLKRAGFLRRDSRIKERKKPGLRRARRAPQFSKR